MIITQTLMVTIALSPRTPSTFRHFSTSASSREKAELSTTLLTVDRDTNTVISFLVETRQADLFAATLVLDFR